MDDQHITPGEVPPEDDGGDDVYVEGEPWKLDSSEEPSRKALALLIIKIYGSLVLAALLLVASGLDSAIALFVIAPFGVIVLLVVNHYFWKGRT